MACFRNCLLLFGLASLGVSQNSESSTSSTATSAEMTTATTSTTTAQTVSTYSPFITPHPLSSYVWRIPFAGISDNASDAWGPYGRAADNSYSIVVNDSRTVPPTSTSGTDVLWRAFAFNDGVEYDGYLLNIAANRDMVMILGNNSLVSATSGAVRLNDTVSTVPFGLNLGHRGFWDGSLILGGSTAGASYDAHRVANGSWAYVPESADGKGTFLKSGKQKLTNITIQQYSSAPSKDNNQAPFFDGAEPVHEPATYSAELDINHDAIVLPAGLNLCNTTNFTITLDTRSIRANATLSYANALTIPIPTRLTRSADRCYTAPTNATDVASAAVVVLGRPFFQAAYLMIPDPSGPIWLAAAHQGNLYPRAALFFPNQTLVAAADPSAAAGASGAPSSPSSSAAAAAGDGDGGERNRTASIVGGVLGGVFALALVSWVAVLAVRHGRRARRLFGKPVQTETETETELLNGIPMESRDR